MIKRLVAIRLRSLIAGLRGKKKDGTNGGMGRMLLLGLAYLYIGAVFLFMFSVSAISYAPIMISAGLDALYFALFMIIAFSMIFFFSVFETKAHLFECRDNALLGAMPIKPGDIVVSRIIVVLILNYVEAAVAFLPAVIAYAVFGGSVLGTVGSLAVFILLPPLATAASSGVGYLVALLSKKFKNNSIIPLVLTLAFLALYFWGASSLLSVPEELEDVENLIPILSEALGPVSVIGLAALCHPIATPIFVILCVGASLVSFKFISRGYTRLAATEDLSGKKKYKSEPSRASGVLRALLKKEFRRLTSSATYMLNGGIGAIMFIVLAVAGAVKGGEIVTALDMILSEVGITLDPNICLPALATAALVLLSSTVTLSASAFSLEGKSFYLLRSMPVSSRSVVLAKVVPHIAVSSVGSLSASVIITVAFGIEPLYAVFVVLTPIFANVFAAFVGITMNILMPKLDYENEVQPIKQSASVGLTMLITMVFGMLYFLASIWLLIMGLGSLVIYLGALAVFAVAVIFAVIALLPIARRIDRISA